jgi:transposase
MALVDLHRKSGEAFIALEAILMKQQRFTQEFKDEAVRLVLTSGRRQAEVARDLGLGVSTLDRWLSQARGRVVPVDGAETPEAELKRIRRENAVLRQEREILKKATAFFASETNR